MLSDFFRINLPYGIKCNDKNEWAVFNREGLPLGESNRESEAVLIYTSFKGITEASIKKVITDDKRIIRNQEGKINSALFYNDKTNPNDYAEYWDDYSKILKHFSKYKPKK